MRGLAARRARAIRRSVDNDRLTRKAATVDKSKAEQEFDRLMHELRNERAAAMKAANRVYTDAIQQADKDRREAVKKAEADYVDKRDKIINRLAPKAEDAA